MKKRSSLVLALAALFAAATPLHALSAPDASMLQPVQRWIDAYNSGTGPLPEDIFTDDVVITDEFPPYVWSGKSAEHAWASAIDAFIKPGKQHVSIGSAQAFESTDDGTRVTFVLPATLTLTSSRSAKQETQHALWLFVLVKAAGGWKIAADSWTTQTAAPGAVSVPLRNENGVLLLSATLNGIGPLLFTFDPGASDLYTRHARARLNGSAAQIVCLSRACFPAGMEYFDGDPAQLDPKHDASLGILAGSIGPQLLRRYVARIDYITSTLTLIPAEQFQPPRDAQALALSFDSFKIPAIAGSVDGHRGLFELDVRAPTSMLFAPFLERTGLRKGYGKARGPYAIRSVQISGADVHGAAFWFSTATSGKFAAGDVAGLLGNNVLSRFVVTLDLPRQRAYLVAGRRR